jgi:hypothetical protein
VIGRVGHVIVMELEEFAVVNTENRPGPVPLSGAGPIRMPRSVGSAG